MAEKRVSVRLAAVGGRQVRAELEGVGEAGSRGFGRLSREMEAANARLAAFSRRVAVAAAAAVAAATAAGVAMIRSGLQTVDAQAKLAQSLGTTVASIQALERAGELAGVSMSGIEQATKDLTRRLSQAAAGSGPAADALKRLELSATDLLALPLDARVGAINAAIESFVPAAERAAVAGQLFGEEGSIAMSRIDTATLRQATEDVLAFGVVVSEQDADQIERTNDALSRLGLIWRGLSNQLAVAAAPALDAVAEAMAAVASRTGLLGQAIEGLFEHMGRLVTYVGTAAALLAGRWVAGLVAAAVSVQGLATALVVLRGALVRTGFGALVVGAGELVYRFTELVRGAGSFGAALELLGRLALAVWDGIRTSMGALVDGFGAVTADIEALWLRLMQRLAEGWAGFLARIAPAAEALSESLNLDLGVDAMGAAAWASSFDGAIARAEAEADAIRARAGTTLSGAFDGVGAVMAELAAVSAAAEAGRTALETADLAAGNLATTLAEEVGAAGTAGLEETAAAASRAGSALSTAADQGRAAWEAAQTALEATKEVAKGLAEDITGPIKEALKSGEWSWQSFAEAIAGIARNLASRLI
ncbi:MAG: phage tail tape measure protein, partial [Rhodobacteraceae bacterium]|nr:phage tail tape measure protein [Paracoccaceae bacterium]